MDVNVDGLSVRFPFTGLYPEQYQLMLATKRALDGMAHSMLQVSAGTGERLAVLALVLAYKDAHPDASRILFCVPSSVEQAACVADLDLLSREAENGKCATFLAVSLESKGSLCIQPSVKDIASADDLEDACRSATAPWSRPTVYSFDDSNTASISQTNGAASRCSFFDKLTLKRNSGEDAIVGMSGCFGRARLKHWAIERHLCPFYLAQAAAVRADIIILPQQMVLDPKAAPSFVRDMLCGPPPSVSSLGNAPRNGIRGGLKRGVNSRGTRDTTGRPIVLFQDAHNLETACVDALSFSFSLRALDSAASAVKLLKKRMHDGANRSVGGATANDNVTLVDKNMPRGHLSIGYGVVENMLRTESTKDDVLKTESNVAGPNGTISSSAKNTGLDDRLKQEYQEMLSGFGACDYSVQASPSIGKDHSEHRHHFHKYRHHRHIVPGKNTSVSSSSSALSSSTNTNQHTSGTDSNTAMTKLPNDTDRSTNLRTQATAGASRLIVKVKGSGSMPLASLPLVLPLNEWDRHPLLRDPWPVFGATTTTKVSHIGATQNNGIQVKTEANVAVNGNGTEAKGGSHVISVDHEQRMPGSLRHAAHVIKLLDVIIKYLKSRLVFKPSSKPANNALFGGQRGNSSLSDGRRALAKESPVEFLQGLERSISVEARPLSFLHVRLVHLLHTLQESSLVPYESLLLVTQMMRVLTTTRQNFRQGLCVMVEQNMPQTPDHKNPCLRLVCLDPVLPLGRVLMGANSVVMFGSAMSDLDVHSTILGLGLGKAPPTSIKNNNNSHGDGGKGKARKVILESMGSVVSTTRLKPLIVSRGSDQTPVRVESTEDPTQEKVVLRNYGMMLVDAVKSVPDGVVAFFPTYSFMEAVLNLWNSDGSNASVLREVHASNKLVFTETKDTLTTTAALANYRRACDSGRGGVFFAVARGPVARLGNAFHGHYGRCAIMFGMPFPYMRSRVLLARLEYMRTVLGIHEAKYLSFDALRVVASCVRGLVKSKSDYAVLLLADKRYANESKKKMLPLWLSESIDDTQTSMSTEEAVLALRSFLREASQQAQLRTVNHRATVYTQREVEGGRPEYEFPAFKDKKKQVVVRVVVKKE